jgi:predicted RecB family endonuclease
MNAQRLAQVLDNVEEAAAFAPGGSSELVALTPQEKMTASRDSIIESATRLAADMIAVYQNRADEAQKRLASIKEIAEQLIAKATQTADEVDKLNARDQAIGEGVARILAEHGIEFMGPL